MSSVVNVLVHRVTVISELWYILRLDFHSGENLISGHYQVIGYKSLIYFNHQQTQMWEKLWNMMNLVRLQPQQKNFVNVNLGKE